MIQHPIERKQAYIKITQRVGDPVPEKTIGKRPWVPVGGPRGVGIVGVLSKESRVNRGSGEVVVSTPSQQWFMNYESTLNTELWSRKRAVPTTPKDRM
jgi:hypothetical protein